MKLKTQYFAARAYPPDIDRLRQLREQLQDKNPGHTISMADVLHLAVQSASVAIANGTPVAASLPPLRLPGDDQAA